MEKTEHQGREPGRAYYPLVATDKQNLYQLSTGKSHLIVNFVFFLATKWEYFRVHGFKITSHMPAMHHKKCKRQTIIHKIKSLVLCKKLLTLNKIKLCTHSCNSYPNICCCPIVLHRDDRICWLKELSFKTGLS